MPNAPSATLAIGLAKLGWLNTLYAFAPSPKLTRSVIGIIFRMVKSESK